MKTVQILTIESYFGLAMHGILRGAAAECTYREPLAVIHAPEPAALSGTVGWEESF